MKKPNRQLKKWLLGSCIAALLAIFFFFPLNAYIEKPGKAVALADLISVDGKTDKESGSFSLTYVSMIQATPFSYLKAKVTPYQKIISSKEYLAGSSNQESYQELQDYYTQASKIAAEKQALSAAGLDYQLDFKGLKVIDMNNQSDFYQKVALGDVIIKFNQQSFNSLADFLKLLQKNTKNTFTLTLIRNQKQLTVTGKLVRIDKQLRLGLGLGGAYELSTTKKIHFETEGYSGPSAGLMFSLELYEQLTKQNIRKGKQIAGTGTIELDGSVGQIGGIEQKVVAAANSNMDIFFAPNDPETKDNNYTKALATARAIKTKMKIVPVTSFQDALDYLAKMK